jgi:hypothetical protein
MGRGYVAVKTEAGWQYEHRAIWEAAYGPLPKGHVVHHINGDKHDNRIENLMAGTQAEHLGKFHKDGVPSTN